MGVRPGVYRTEPGNEGEFSSLEDGSKHSNVVLCGIWSLSRPDPTKE